jgi:voltage-gated potassium channel
MRFGKRLRTALTLLLAVLVGATVGYRLLGGPQVRLLDAIYMAVITISTVGYTEVVDTSRHPALRVFNMFVVVFGIGVMLYVFSESTAFIVEGELQNVFRRRKMLKRIQNLRRHFIICGAGRTGQYVVEELLKTGHSFVVIDRDEEQLNKLSRHGDFPVLTGDATDDEVLAAAGLDRAQGLVSVLPDDRDNLMVTVAVRQKNPGIRIVASCTQEDMADRLTRVGANSAVSPSFIGGLRLASELIRPHVVSFLDVMLREKSQTLRVDESVVCEGSRCAGRKLCDLKLPERFGLLLLAIRHASGETKFNPTADTILTPGDVLILMGEVNQVWKLRPETGDTRGERERQD